MSIIRTPWVSQLQALLRKQEDLCLATSLSLSFSIIFPSDSRPPSLPLNIASDVLQWSEVGFTGVWQWQQKEFLEDGGDRKDSRKKGKGVSESMPRIESDSKEGYI